MRNPETGKNVSIENMSYQDWQKSVVTDVILKTGIAYSKSSFVKMDKSLIDKSIQQANRILNEYPMVSDSIREDGGITFDVVNATYKAATASNNSRIVFSSRFYSDRNTYMKALEYEIKTGFKMRVPKKYYDIYTITHEMGHVIENYIVDGKKITKSEYNKRATMVKNDIIKIAQRITGKTRSELLARMSGYGHRNQQEFFAEAFVAYKLGSTNVWGVAMREYLKRRKLK